MPEDDEDQNANESELSKSTQSGAISVGQWHIDDTHKLLFCDYSIGAFVILKIEWDFRTRK